MSEERRALETTIRAGNTPGETEAVSALREEIRRLNPRVEISLEPEADELEVQREDGSIKLSLLARTVHAYDAHPISGGVLRYASGAGERLLLEPA